MIEIALKCYKFVGGDFITAVFNPSPINKYTGGRIREVEYERY